MTGATFLHALQRECEKHPGVTHPFLTKLAKLDDDGIKLFASQFYLYVRMFPRLMGAVVYTVPDEAARLPLILMRAPQEICLLQWADELHNNCKARAFCS